MKKIVIFASNHCLFSTVGAPMDMFLQAGILWNGLIGIDPSPYFDVKIVTLDGKPVLATNQVPITPHCSISEIEHADLILIPSQGMQFNIQNEHFYQQVEWLKKWYQQGADLASICTGAFTLAATGLLDGKTATTHWGVAKQFRAMYPNIDLRTDLMVTDEERIFCGGGVTADLNLAMYLINKYCGREVALQSSRCTLVDLDKLSQSAFSVFIPEKNHEDMDILNSQKFIENNLSRNLTIDELASMSGMSKRNFNRRFKAATGESVIKYIHLVRVEAAKAQLENNTSTFDQIAYDLGYENTSFFRRIFKRTTGLSPSSYRKKFIIS